MQLDHLVLAARTLADGVAWCEATLGIVPGPGGSHAIMGTHNRLFGIGSAAFPRAYFEIIAIDPAAQPPARPRWFDLDSPALTQALSGGPALIHWVARCDDVHAVVAGLQAKGIDRGEVLPAERATPRGLLRWQITLRGDGQRLFGGALPTLIQWGRDEAAEARAPSPASGSGMPAAARTAGDVHPTDTLPPSGVTLAQFSVRGLPAAVEPMLPAAVRSEPATRDAAPLRATLDTPRGRVVLHSLQTPTDHVQA